MVGKLTTIYGPMFAGKTTEIQNMCMSAIEEGKNIILAKYKHDIRYTKDATIINHDGNKLDKNDNLYIVEISDSSELLDILNSDLYISNHTMADIIIIDEAQFYTDIAQTIDIFKTDARYKNIDIILAGLDLDANCQFFNRDFNYLIASSDIAIYKLSKCYICNATAMYTVRLDNMHNQNSRIKIAGASLYQPTCTMHHPSMI